ncbi:Follicle-stimulating hormone receptor [Dirofilaria immitis]
MSNNGLVRMPTLEMTPRHRLAMEVIDFSYNQIEYLGDGQLRAVHANKICLSNNNLREIGSHIFANCRFSLLELNDNLELKRFSIDTFAGISFIKRLDLSRTGITELPTTGLSRLESLKLKDTEELKKLPPILAFTSLKKVEFTYPYHCCLFKYASKEISTAGEKYTKNLEEIRNRECSTKSTSKLNRRRRQSARNDRSILFQESRENPLDLSDLLQWFDSVNAGNITIEIDDEGETLLEPEFEDADIGLLTTLNCTSNAVSNFFASIECTPMPNALNPCEDVIGYDFLRWAIWFVWISAIVGNVGVWIVLCQMRQKRMQVHYFFMANLSAADLLTGVYLGILAIADYKTSNEYYNYAVAWQTGVGCNIAGFISVFSSEISIMSMFLIAFDMCYNIRNAFYGKRLRMRTAIKMMIVAYIIAFTMAVLPILGVSTYTSTSVCLPLSIEDNFDRIYVIASLLFNLLAFLGMAISYSFIVTMLCDPDQPKRSEDKAIILKMATLIGTEMLCWFPTLFFGFTAALGHPLISISVAKIFLVLFYPINAFTNPFLYVFLTKIIRLRPCSTSIFSKTPNIRNELNLDKPSNIVQKLNAFFCMFHHCDLNLRRAGKMDESKKDARLRGSLLDLRKAFENYNVYRSLPSSMFKKKMETHDASTPPEKRPLISTERLRVSAVPRMSDISEHVTLEKNVAEKSLSQSSNFSQQQLPIEKQNYVILPKQLQNRRSSVRSTGKDSGRGSLTPPIPSYRFPNESDT